MAATTTDWHIRRKEIRALIDALENDEPVSHETITAAIYDLWMECHERGRLIDKLYDVLYAGQQAFRDVDKWRETIGDPRR